MINVTVKGKDSHPLQINSEGEASVVVHPHPPKNEDISGAPLPFRQYFTDDGYSSGSNDMIVTGTAAAPLDFYISANQNYDIYIKQISVVIGDDGSPALNKYGAIGALTNGVQWVYQNQAEGEYELHDGIKTNLEFIRIGTDTGAIGTGVDAYLADVTGGGTEKSYLPMIDLAETFGMPWGVRLVKGSEDKLIFRVRDDLSTLVTHNIIGYGIRF